MCVDVGRAVVIVKDSLVFLYWAEDEDDEVVHQGQGLAGFPWPEDGAVIDFVLGLCKDLDSGVSPVGVRSGGVGDDGGLSFRAELGVLVERYALGEELRVERDGLGGCAAVGSTEGLEELKAEDYVVGGDGVRGFAGSEAKSFVDGRGQKGGVVGG